MYARLADAIADAAAQDVLEPGSRLPAERALADWLGISRGTVVAAYAHLAERGLVERRQGSGTTIAGPRRAAAGRHLRHEVLTRQVSGPPVPIDLALASPPLDAAAADLLIDPGAAVRAGAPAHGYAPLGLPALRQGIAERLTRHGVPTTADQILITNGAQGALQLLTAAFVRPGDRVVVESPAYMGSIELLSRVGALIDGIPLDAGGPRADRFARAAADPATAMALLVPTNHNPTGSTMSERRRREVLAACRDRDLLLVEDVTLAELHFAGEPPPDLVRLDPERVIAVGSFSKVVWGGLRTGWIRADAATILRLARLKAAQDLGSGLLDQAACVAVLPRMDELAASRRRMARERHDVLRTALAEHLPDWRPARCGGGYSLWVQLPSASAGQVIRAALQHGVAIATGSVDSGDERHLDHIRLCFALPPETLVEAVERLRDAWATVQGRLDPLSPLAAV